MKGLLIDTSSPFLILALIEGSEILHAEIKPHQNNLSKFLFTAIQDCLNKYGYTLKDLNFISSGIGPGSYTGTRIGAAVASALSFGLDIPIIPFPSPLAFLPSDKQGRFAYLLANKTGGYFAVKGIVKDGRLSSIEHERQGLSNEREAFDFVIYSSKEQQPQLDLLAPYIYEKWQQKEYTAPDAIELLYLHQI